MTYGVGSGRGGRFRPGPDADAHRPPVGTVSGAEGVCRWRRDPRGPRTGPDPEWTKGSTVEVSTGCSGPRPRAARAGTVHPLPPLPSCSSLVRRVSGPHASLSQTVDPSGGPRMRHGPGSPPRRGSAKRVDDGCGGCRPSPVSLGGTRLPPLLVTTRAGPQTTSRPPSQVPQSRFGCGLGRPDRQDPDTRGWTSGATSKPFTATRAGRVAQVSK